MFEELPGWQCDISGVRAPAAPLCALKAAPALGLRVRQMPGSHMSPCPRLAAACLCGARPFPGQLARQHGALAEAAALRAGARVGRPAHGGAGIHRAHRGAGRRAVQMDRRWARPRRHCVAARGSICEALSPCLMALQRVGIAWSLTAQVAGYSGAQGHCCTQRPHPAGPGCATPQQAVPACRSCMRGALLILLSKGNAAHFRPLSTRRRAHSYSGRRPKSPHRSTQAPAGAPARPPA